MQTTHVIVEGRVQGVCFRDYASRQALLLNLTGWVRNLPNGSVEAMLHGAAEDVASMIEWLWQGSPRSKVDNIRTRNTISEEYFTSFEIRF